MSIRNRSNITDDMLQGTSDQVWPMAGCDNIEWMLYSTVGRENKDHMGYLLCICVYAIT